MSRAPRDCKMSAITGRGPELQRGLRVVSALVWGPFGCLYVSLGLLPCVICLHSHSS